MSQQSEIDKLANAIEDYDIVTNYQAIQTKGYYVERAKHLIMKHKIGTKERFEIWESSYSLGHVKRGIKPIDYKE